MKIITPPMKEAVASIKESMKSKGEEVTDERLAQKINISAEQLYKYIANETDVPNGLTDSLLKAYGIQIVELTDRKIINGPRIITSLPGSQ